MKHKKKITLKQAVTAALTAGAKVSVELKPKPVDLEPLRRMAQDLNAIWLLAETRSRFGIEAAQDLCRRISFNEVQFILMNLHREWMNKPAMEAKVMP